MWENRALEIRDLQKFACASLAAGLPGLLRPLPGCTLAEKPGGIVSGRDRRAAPLAETQMIVPSGRVLFCELFQNLQDMGTSLRFAIGKGARYFLANVVPADQPGKLFLEICLELQVVTVFQLFRESG